MKTLIIYKSYHKMKMEKIAKVIAQEMNAKLAKVENVKPEDLVEYEGKLALIAGREKGHPDEKDMESAQVADISISNLYFYFKDKDTIFIEIIN